MQVITAEKFKSLLDQVHIKPRLRRELRFVPDATIDWQNMEFVNVTDRNGDRGVFLIEPYNQLFVVPYELSRRIANKQTGRTKPIICDLCYSWQSGSNSGRISFVRPIDSHTVTLLCCADLKCSEHVRDKTKAATLSRAQLHEDLTTEQRVERLKSRMQQLCHSLGLQPVTLSPEHSS